MPESAQRVKPHVAARQHVLLPACLLLLVFSTFSFASPFKIADRAGRGCSAPLWSPDNRFIAFTTMDNDELYVVTVGKSKEEQSLYRVANAEGVGRRFVFVPGEERLAFRRMAGALATHADRILSLSFYTHDPIMLTNNDGPILGPYRIENQIFYRESLTSPLVSMEGKTWRNSVVLEDGELIAAGANGKDLFESSSSEKVEGFEISPDGTWVAMVYKTETDRQVRLVSLESGQVIELGKGRWPSWSGDSNRIVIIRDKTDIKFSDLIVYDLQVSQSRSVTGINQFWPDEPALNSNGTLVAFTHDGEIFVTEVTGF